MLINSSFFHLGIQPVGDVVFLRFPFSEVILLVSLVNRTTPWLILGLSVLSGWSPHHCGPSSHHEAVMKILAFFPFLSFRPTLFCHF